MREGYEISSDAITYTNVEDLVPTEVCAPPGGSSYHPYSIYRTAASGTEYGDGFGYVEWTFRIMSPAYRNALDAYLGGDQSGEVFIKSRKEDDTIGTFYCIMHRPKRDQGECEWNLGAWHDVTYRFTRVTEL